MRHSPDGRQAPARRHPGCAVRVPDWAGGSGQRPGRSLRPASEWGSLPIPHSGGMAGGQAPAGGNWRARRRAGAGGAGGGRPWNRTRHGSPRRSYSPLPHLAARRPRPGRLRPGARGG